MSQGRMARASAGRRAVVPWLDPRGRRLGGWAFVVNRLSGLGLVAYLYLHLVVLSLLAGGPGGWDAFVVKLGLGASSTLTYSARVGGGWDDYGLALAVDRAGAAFVTGYTDSGAAGTAPFPTSPSAFQGALNQGGPAQDAFVGEFDELAVRGVSVTEEIRRDQARLFTGQTTVDLSECLCGDDGLRPAVAFIGARAVERLQERSILLGSVTVVEAATSGRLRGVLVEFRPAQSAIEPTGDRQH